jgi:uncharacterized protein (TIGR02271 family)
MFGEANLAQAREQQQHLLVTDKNGVRGYIDPTAPSPYDGRGPDVTVRLDDGRVVIVPTAALVERKEGGYFLPLSLEEHGSPQHSPPAGTQGQVREALVVPIVEEELTVERRQVETGKVRISKTIDEREETVDLPLMQEEAEVLRVSVGKVVEGPQPVRYSGDVKIIPLLEEVLVVEKRLMLQEELHVRTRRTEVHRPQKVILRSENARVERVGGPEPERVQTGGLPSSTEND